MKNRAINNIQLSLFPDEEIRKASNPAEELLGMVERRFYTGKGINRPSVISNATIFDEKGERIWFGDIDMNMSRDRLALLRLSARIGVLYILNGITTRMFPGYKPSPEQIRKSAAVIVEKGKLFYSKAFAEKVRTLSMQMNQNLKRRRTIWRTSELMF